MKNVFWKREAEVKGLGSGRLEAKRGAFEFWVQDFFIYMEN